jgi:hypothetical protein
LNGHIIQMFSPARDSPPKLDCRKHGSRYSIQRMTRFLLNFLMDV